MIQKERMKWRYKEEKSEWMNKKNIEQKKLVRKYTRACVHAHTHTPHEGVKGDKGKETREKDKEYEEERQRKNRKWKKRSTKKTYRQK